VLLGLDLGTTNIKALLVDDEGRIIARGARPVALEHTPDGGIEQDLETIWLATLEAIREAGRSAAGAGLAAVRAVGISSQGGAIQVRTPDGRCLGPVISWMDPRGVPFDERFEQNVGRDWLVRRTGHGHSNMAIGQVLRLRATRSGLLDPPAVLGFVGDAVVQRLCGRTAHDSSSLSICCLYNPWLQRADPELLERLGLSETQLPELIPVRRPAGPLRPEVARRTGLPAGIPVGPAVHDQYASALGCGAIRAGDVMLGAGTAWVLLAIADRLLPPIVPSAWVCNHLLPDRWGQLLSLVVGGSAFAWACDITGLSRSSPVGRDELDEILASVPPGCEGLRLWPFLDGLGGERRPPDGRLLGLRLAHRREHLLRATVEGLCFELARQVGWIEKAGIPVGRLIMCGGASESRVTPQIVADVTGRPVVCPHERDTSAFGAAILAAGMIEAQAPLADVCVRMALKARELRPGDAAATYGPLVYEYVKALEEHTT